jgi:predicted PurR-regulated permease PerM
MITKGKFFFYALLIIVLFTSLSLLLPYLGAITLALLTAMIFQPVYQGFLNITKQRQTTSILATMMVFMVCVLIPLWLVVQLTVFQLLQLYTDVRAITQGQDLSLQTGVQEINRLLQLIPAIEREITVVEARLFLENTVAQATRILVDGVLRIGAESLTLLAQFFIYLFLLYYALPLYKKIPYYLTKISPLDDKIDLLLITKVQEMAKSMVKGTFVIAAVQAVSGGLLLAAFGAPYVVFLTMLMTLLGIMPIVGASTVLIPAGIVYLLLGQVWQGVTILVVTIIIVANIDNVIRPRLVSRDAALHPALVLLAVLGGLNAFGPLGVIYGPVIMILLTTILTVYQKVQKSD